MKTKLVMAVAVLISLWTASINAAVNSLTVGAQSTTNAPGGTQTYVLKLSGTGSADVTFVITNPLPAGVTASFNPNPVAPSGGAWTTNTVLTITTTTGTPAGTYVFTVRATPSGGGAAATAVNTLVVNIPTTSSLSSSANSVTYGQAVTFTAAVVPSGPGTPTGSVTLLDGATPLGSASLDVTGQAIFLISNLNVAGSPHSVTAVYSGDSTFQGSTSAAVLQTIAPKELTVSGITVANKMYDGTTTATLIKSGAILVGVVSPDVVILSTAGATASFADKNVGISKPVTIAGLTISGTDAANYTLAPTFASASIMPAILTIKADDKIKVAGIANPVLTATYSGFVAGEDANVLTSQITLATTADINSPAGDYPITASGAATAQNYQISYLQGVLSVLLPPMLTATHLEGGLFGLKFDTVPEQRYQVEVCDSLPAATWSPSGLVLTGTGQSLIITNDSSSGSKFFRVEALPRAR